MEDNNQIYLSIVVPVYNVESYLPEFFKSISNQNFDNYEVIIINDGSTDGSYELCKKYALENEKLRIYTKINSGVSDTRNIGLLKASGQYILFLDPDDYIDENLFNVLYETTIEKEIDILMYNYYLVRDDNVYTQYLSKELQKERFLSQDEAFKSLLSERGYQGFVWNKLFDSKIIKAIAFNPKIHFLEDSLFCAKAIKLSKNIYCIPQPYYFYRQREGSAVRGFNQKQLSYFDALDSLINELPKKYTNEIELRRILSLIDFSSRAFLKNNQTYFFLKNKFKENIHGLQISKNNNLKKIEKIFLKTSIFNFHLALILFFLKDKIVNSQIYFKIRSIKK